MPKTDQLTPATELSKLDKLERVELERAEKIIQAGLHTFIEVGNALLTIRDHRLYRMEFDTFENYCRKKWSMSKTHANRLIASAAVAHNVAPVGVMPVSESQIRALARLDPAQQKRVWGQVVRKADTPAEITARDVRESVDSILERKGLKPRAIRDVSPPIPRAELLDAVDQWWRNADRKIMRPEEIVSQIRHLIMSL